MERSRNDSSRDDTYAEKTTFRPQHVWYDDEHTVSQVRHRVSLVRTPSKSLCTSVASCGNCPEFELEPELVVLAFDAIVDTDVDTLKKNNP
jgi:hypothetical protein